MAGLQPNRNFGILDRLLLYGLLNSLPQPGRALFGPNQVAGLGLHVHPHMLWHARGFALAGQGTDTRLIQSYLGHRDIGNTAIYTETSQKRLAGVRVR
jgi:integrase